MDNWIPDDNELQKMLGNNDIVEQQMEENETIKEESKVTKQIEYKDVVFEELTEEVLAESFEREFGVSLGLVLDVELPLSVRLGEVEMPLGEVADLKVGSIISLERLAGEMVDVLIGGELVAKGDVVVTVDKYGLVIKDIVEPRERIRSQGESFKDGKTSA